MNKDEIKEPLKRGTCTAKLGTINKGGSLHITPIWFILGKNDIIVFTTYRVIKSKKLSR